METLNAYKEFVAFAEQAREYFAKCPHRNSFVQQEDAMPGTFIALRWGTDGRGMRIIRVESNVHLSDVLSYEDGKRWVEMDEKIIAIGKLVDGMSQSRT